MKKCIVFVSVLYFLSFFSFCKPHDKQANVFSSQLIKILDSLGINCESKEGNISLCDLICLSIEWIRNKDSTDSLLLVTDKNCHGSGDMRIWLCQNTVSMFHVAQSFVSVQSVVEDSLPGTSFLDLHITHSLSPSMGIQRESITVKYRFSNGIFIPLEIETINNMDIEIPVVWLEQSGKNIDGCSFLINDKKGVDTLQLKYFTKERVSEVTNNHKEIWLLKYIDSIHFVANTWVFESNAEVSKLLAFFPWKIISATNNIADNYPEFRLSFESISDSLQFPNVYYRWNGQTFEANTKDTGAYYFGNLESIGIIKPD